VLLSTGTYLKFVVPKGGEMKSLIRRFASIGAIFSLVLAASSATMQAQDAISPSVEVDKAVIMGEQTSTIVLVEVTFLCVASTANHVTVTITQLSTDSSNGIGGGPVTASEPVSCNGKPRRIAVSIVNGTPAVPTFNLGKATVTAKLFLGAVEIANDTETKGIGFPGGGGDEDH
jgi:hypothetical protein